MEPSPAPEPSASASGARGGELDLIIIGAGPAGLSAAVVAQALKLRTVVLEAGDRAGGQLLQNPTPILDCAGLESPTGVALSDKLFDHLTRAGGHVRTSRGALRVDVARGEVEVEGERLWSRFLLLSTGARRRMLGVPGESDALGRGLWPAARRHASLYRGRSVLVVGGGDVALEEALLFAKECDRVYLAHRGAHFRARPDYQSAVASEPRIEVMMETSLLSIEGEPSVVGAQLRSPAGPRRIDVTGVFLCVGVAPNSELVLGQASVDAQGFVLTDMQQRTSAPRLYAAGDVCAGSTWTVAAALGQAAIAVKTMERRICSGDAL